MLQPENFLELNLKFSKRTLFSQINERPFCKKCKTFPGTDIDSEKVQLGPWLFNRTIASDKNIKKLYFKSKTARCGNSMHASNWKKMPKIDTLDALGDAITTILTTILTTNPDNHLWQQLIYAYHFLTSIFRIRSRVQRKRWILSK